ncbi:MAG: hypothetical protein KF684_01160 [Phycisphaeraceae bacterium]|nr:hypothetical protein [Phycisphaeraceae bacterium]
MIRPVLLATVLWAVPLAGVAAAQPVAQLGSGIASLDARLAALTPSRPIAYFELAEEVASEIQGPEGRALARRLFVLAYELDRAAGASSRLSRSVCLALLELDLLDSDEDRKYVGALAEAMRSDDDIYEPPGMFMLSRGSQGSDDASLALATALGEYRAGRFLEAREPLARTDVRSLLAQHAPTLRNVAGMLREIESRPSCRECRNLRAVRDDLNPDSRRRLCRTCGGDPSPALSPIDLVSQMRVESLLLSGADAAWSAQTAAGRVEPFQDIDPARLAERLRVPTDRTIWREGGWVPATQAPSRG